MNDNKGQTIFLSVIGIATLLVAIVGATFAWFSASVTGNESASSIIVTTARIASVTFTDGKEINTLYALPGWSDTKTFTITHPGGNTVDQTIKVYLHWKHKPGAGGTVATDLHYTLTGDGALTPVTIGAESTGDDYTKSEIASKTITGNTTTAGTAFNETYSFFIEFPEVYADQNSQQGAQFTGYLSVELDGVETMYYNTSNPSGTTVQPVAP